MSKYQMNMISQIRKQVVDSGQATISAEQFNQLQEEWIKRCATNLPEKIEIEKKTVCGFDAVVASELLNDLLILVDLNELVKTRVFTKDKFSAESSPFMFGLKDGHCEIGLLGVINGFMRNGVVAADFENGELKSFFALK